MKQGKWGKLLLDATINPLGAIAGVRNGDLLRPPLREALEAVVGELTLLLKKAHCPLPFSDPWRAVQRACQTGASRKNPLLQDLEKGRPTERSAVLGPFFKLSRKTHVSLPRLTLLNELLKKLEK